MSSSTPVLNIPTVTLPTGAKHPVVGLGTWRSEKGEVEQATYEAIKLGYRHIDCARVYANEAEVGRGIARALKEGLIKREELFVTSKVWNNAHTAERANANLTATLKDLQLDYIDLWLMHWPVNFKYVEGESMPKDDKGIIMTDSDESQASIKICWTVMEKAFDDGKVKAIGVSNFVPQEIDDLLKYARIKPAANQVEIHPYLPQDDLLAYCKKQNILVQGYSPLGNLKSAGREDVTPLNEPSIAELGKKYGKSPAQIILRWGVQHTGVVLPKSCNPARIKENADLFDFTLSDEDMNVIKELGKKNLRFVNPEFRPNNGKVFA